MTDVTGITAGMYLTRLLALYGVDTVFGIPGVHTVELYRGLPGSGIRHVTPRHEQGAGFMADGYARVGGKPGVCFIISGPGMTNIATAMGQAYGDSIPMLVISAVNAHGRMGSGEGWLHELPNQQALVSGVAAFSRTINTVEELAPALAQAFAIFDGARARPVHLEIPINIMTASADHLPLPKGPMRLARAAPDPAALETAARRLSDASAPVILAGGGARHAMGLRSLAEALDAPVVMTANARGLLAPDHPLGVSLSASMPETRAMIAAADVVLALGTEMGRTDYDMFEDDGFTLTGEVIRVDLDPVQLARSAAPDPGPNLGIVADAAAMVEGLLDRCPPGDSKDGAARAAAANAGRTALDDAMRGDLKMLEATRDALPGVIFMGDSSQATYAGNLGYAAARPGTYHSSTTGFGTLGYGLPAAIGAKLTTDSPVVALAGDGGFQFTAPEMASAVEAGTPVIVMLYDNSGYGEIKSFMEARGIGTVGVDLYTPDLRGLAAASGWKVAEAETPQGLRDALDAASKAPTPTLVYYTDRLRTAFQAEL
ncbi:5-guanidino-2-oxopentanoate decarboxylase [Nioella nitratireducens]|uniref:5-guanidino-2-oxopentanoate decarboxylase n=1 Tax=Nioella nitratireducens TaxID=1287720 RepID=UPI0008FD505B|nr:5-guanidino-2-oxopentanoate decarboxylase [Nioella nitratireducens]